jgi:hypothetical protein
MGTGTAAVVIGVMVGSFVTLLGRVESMVPRLALVWSIVAGVLGALLGVPLWQLLGLDMPELVAQLSGAIIAIDLYMIGVKLAERS